MSQPLMPQQQIPRQAARAFRRTVRGRACAARHMIKPITHRDIALVGGRFRQRSTCGIRVVALRQRHAMFPPRHACICKSAGLRSGAVRHSERSEQAGPIPASPHSRGRPGASDAAWSAATTFEYRRMACGGRRHFIVAPCCPSAPDRACMCRRAGCSTRCAGEPLIGGRPCNVDAIAVVMSQGGAA